MNRTKRIICAVALASLALIVLVVAVGMVHAQDRPRFARASESQGDVWVLRMGEEEWELCGLNTPLGESDIMETEGDSYAEIEFDNGIILSLDEETRVDMNRLSYNNKGGRTTVLKVHHGAVRVHVPSYAGPADYLTLRLPTGSVDVDGNSTARINVRGSKSSEILVYRGQAILVGRDGEAVIRSGEKGYLDSEGYLGAILAIPRVRDEFDLWCARNYEKFTARESRVYLDGDGYYAGLYDLDYHGDWVFVAEYGRCWRPRTVHGWYPYRDGHWVWSVHWGWTWVSYEPWGWVPYHYGRWVHSWRWGWVWVPGRVWGPAWVTWVYYDDCIGWGPLCPWGHPCYCYEYRCHGPWTYVYRYSFYHPHWRYRHRRHGRYKYWKWGEKRYKYRDGRKHDKADFKRNGPESPRVATKNMKLTDAEKKIMKAESKMSSYTPKTIPREKDAARTVDSKDLPSKPRDAKAKRDNTVDQKHSEVTRPSQADRSDKLPPKPKKTESSTNRSSQESETRVRESTRPSRTDAREESSYEDYESPSTREVRKESATERRSESRTDERQHEREEKQPRTEQRTERSHSVSRKEKDERESRREDDNKSRTESDRSTASRSNVKRKSVR